ncbi:DUF4034 domain-containing protein [Massilia sp. Dwa41.01b]|uniref:DUF4034 domain-containing protein n=1 Tax=unclassified Massilia TaxID=2609279 RepID=UPI001603261B|nr:MULTISPECIES: DUF4034 domain-containing protein [unclassified Massilia]QNA89982.1 DUF4034 domain-containing protein [Massilia sp. Dwa41.01b]QNB00864.1 DUF4034 domain-containing protein [Massilia sp. Se16.2.3]
MRLSQSRTSLAHRLLLPAALALASLAPAVIAAEPEAKRSPITEASERALWWGDFGALEKQNAYFMQPGRLEPDGTSQVSLFREGYGNVLYASTKNPEIYLKELDALTLQWAKEHPRSALAHILHARSLLAHGQSYRGGSYAKDVPPEAWKFYHEYLRQAAEYLKDHAEVALTDSDAHYVLLSIGRGLGWSSEQMVAIAEDGLKRNPDDVSLHFAVVDHLLPKWNGTPRELDTYILQATEKTRGQFGTGMYARLYSAAAEDQFGSGLFEDSYADWDKMKRGYEDLLARYPASVRQRNRYAHMACVAKDKEVMLRLLKEIGSEVRTKEWGRNPKRAFETCRLWATSVPG